MISTELEKVVNGVDFGQWGIRSLVWGMLRINCMNLEFRREIWAGEGFEDSYVRIKKTR